MSSNRSKVKDTSQYLDNLAWDDQNNLPMQEIVYSPDGGVTINRVAVTSDGKVPVDATFSGTVTSAPTYKEDPTNALETPKFGKVDPTTHKQQVLADTGLTQPTTPSDTQPISAAALPLPAGASTAAKQLPDNHNVTVTSAPITAVTAAALPLPAGASTAALQTTGNASLNSIDSKLILPSTLDTDRLKVKIDNETTGSVLGRVYLVDPTNTNRAAVNSSGQVGVIGPLTDTQLRATPVPVSGTVTATPSGTQDDNIKQVNGVTVNVGTGTAGTGTQRVAVSSDSFPVSQAVTGTFFQATQPVSATALPLPSGASTAALQTTGNSSLASIDTKLSGTLSTSTTGNVGTTSHVVNVGQTTSNTTRVQLTASSIVSTNGILVQGLSGNVASIFIGDNTVTTSTGFELQAGQAVPFTTANINNLYVIGANGTDGACWSVL